MIGEKDADQPMHLDVQARNKKDAEAAEKLCKGGHSQKYLLLKCSLHRAFV